MNIFVLDSNPKLAAQYHCDQHCVKMITEYAQLLSTAHRILDGDMYIDDSSGRKIKRWRLADHRENSLYKATHINHPCSIWTRESSENYIFLYTLYTFLHDEYKQRYNRDHKAYITLKHDLADLPTNINRSKGYTTPPQAMPEYCQTSDVVTAYRNFYNLEKYKFARWKLLNLPHWYNHGSTRVVN